MNKAKGIFTPLEDPPENAQEQRAIRFDNAETAAHVAHLAQIAHDRTRWEVVQIDPSSFIVVASKDGSVIDVV